MFTFFSFQVAGMSWLPGLSRGGSALTLGEARDLSAEPHQAVARNIPSTVQLCVPAQPDHGLGSLGPPLPHPGLQPRRQALGRPPHVQLTFES